MGPRRSQEVLSPCHRHELGHPVPPGHEGIEPLDGEDPGAGVQPSPRSLRRGARGLHPHRFHPGAQRSHEGRPPLGDAQGIGHRLMILQYIVQRAGTQRHDPGGRIQKLPGRRLNLRKRHRTYLALVLGQDEVRGGGSQALGIELVNREPLLQQPADPPVNLPTGLAIGSIRHDPGRRRKGQRLYPWGMVTLMGSKHELVPHPQGVDHFSGGG